MECVTVRGVLTITLLAAVIHLLLKGWFQRHDATVGRPCLRPQPAGRDLTGGPYAHGAVATDALECSAIGSDILEKGGSAVDAAIASLLCIGLTNADSSGIGGGLFMTIYNRETRTAETINARAMAPAAATENMFQWNHKLSTLGGLAVAVPGEILAFWRAHQRHGKLPWRDLFQPAIQLAEEGVCIGGYLAATINEKSVDMKRPQSGLCDVFCDENNNVLRENQIMKRAKLAETLRAVADGGADVFYQGEIARNLVKDIRDAGGIITEQDLRDYQVEVTPPLNISLAGGLTVLSPPPPAGGAVLSLILNILDGYRFSPASVDGVDNQILTYHRIIEAFKFAYAKRSELGDPNFVDIDELTRNMTSDDYAESLRRRITDGTTHDYRYYDPSFVLPEDSGTSHVSVLGPNGDAVSVTSTVNLCLGSKLRSASTGVILNNLMDDFSSPNLTNFFGVPPSPANFIRPGKRPVSSMTPTVVVDGNGDVRLVTGASGGTKITTATAYVLMQHLWFGLDLGPAVETPRLHHQLLPDLLFTEKTRPFKPEAVLEGLQKKNHVTDVISSACVNSVARKGGVISAASDSRKGGFPVGF
ncbi:PREDICTED: gamma-glutamyltranspeptidase 1-like [Branchiostoma belcheri]|uniref:Glutathione hydrolase n=1 Tax=Branchiostoma belcheri TaxID=7741 RepID=A0A6P4YMW7_BRABE|nr:PREDICTED: gamma-glutamyltranspeptidase 1-like [Branchiostoma belcheri]